MRDKFFIWLGRVSYRRWWLVLLLSLLVTAIFGSFAGKIKMEATWISILPQEDASVKSFKKIIDQFGAATNIILAVESEGDDKARLKMVADELAAGLKNIIISFPDSNGALRTIDAFRRIEHRYDIGYLKNHGLMLEKSKNLKKNKILYTDYNLVPFLTHMNDVFESQWVADADNLSKQEKEAERGLDGTFLWFETLSNYVSGNRDDSMTIQSGIDYLTVGDGYYLSSDKKMLMIFITPNVTINEIEGSVAAVDSLDSRLNQYREKYPEMRFALTGMHVVMRDEMQAGMSDTIRNLSVALCLILIIFILSFRMWSGPLLAMMVLIVGIIWDIGLAQIVFGRLNIMTAMSAVILIGLGIDFAIHIISSYSELRHKGESVEVSISESFRKIGTGLLTGGLTTAIAFLSIVTIGSDAFREFGFVIGSGIICCLLASLFVLPAALVAREKLWGLISKNKQPKRVNMEFRFIGRLAERSTRGAWIIVFVALAITIFLGFQIHKGRMNDNYMDLEPEGLESIRLQREIVKRFFMSPDNMMSIYDNIGQVDSIQDRLNSQSSIGMVESIASVLPTKIKQERRRPLLEEIRRTQSRLPKLVSLSPEQFIVQLQRLSDNIIEISSMAFIGGQDRVFAKANQFVGLDEDGNQVGPNHAIELAEYIRSNPESIGRLENYQKYFREKMRRRLHAMSNPEEISLEMVPESFRDRYVSKDGSHFLVSFYARKDIWDGLFTSPFVKTMTRFVPDATGSPIFMKVMVEAAGKDGRFAFAVALAAIFLLLIFDFRSLKMTMIALLPLVMSIVCLLGIMGLFDIRYTIVNVIGFPLLLGIGIDDGVHVIHRYRIEGRQRLAPAMSSIGKAILLTSVTTMLGFGSLMSSEYRGYIGLGLVVLIGIGLCFITSVIILPAILQLVWGGKENKKFFTGPSE